MSTETVFENQALDLTLTCKDNNGAVIDLSGRTVHFLTRDPEGTVTTDESPTIADPTNGQVKHSYPAGPVEGSLTPAGQWMAKVLIDGDEVPSTRYGFYVYSRWDA
jgi:hypothetical protein